jgi:hypothetical protein
MTPVAKSLHSFVSLTERAGDQTQRCYVARSFLAEGPAGGCRRCSIQHRDRRRCVLQGDGIDAQLVEGRTTGVGVGWNDIEPVDQTGIDLGIEPLPEMRRERLEHVGRTGAAVRHVDEGELKATPQRSERRQTRRCLRDLLRSGDVA